MAAGDDDIEAIARARIRTLRHAMGWSLDQLATRSHLSASTLSRIETGHRTIGLDVLVLLARALHVDVDELIGTDRDDADIVIRTEPQAGWAGSTVWTLSRPTSQRTAIKVLLAPNGGDPDLQVHPGHDWFLVLAGSVRLTLATRTIRVEAGEAAEFSTMTPHAVDAIDGPAELVMIFDRDGQRAHLHHGADARPV